MPVKRSLSKCFVAVDGKGQVPFPDVDEGGGGSWFFTIEIAV